MEAILLNVGQVVTASIVWMGDFLGVITAAGNEILLLFVIIPVVGLGIGLLQRLINLR